ncbi:MAG: hypothetical protein IJW32_04045 [Clostridia bacterium]|nr:hypothetical protein [Clostridia bacterium]
MENVKNVNESLVESEEVNEEKIEVVIDYSPLLKGIRLATSQTRFGNLYFLNVDVGGLVLKFKIDEGLYNYIKTCEKLNKQPFKLKSIVKERNIEKNKIFTSLKLINAFDNVFRYFVDRIDVDSLDLLLADFNFKNKK